MLGLGFRVVTELGDTVGLLLGLLLSRIKVDGIARNLLRTELGRLLRA